jgi:hypothetical protein
MASSLHSVIDYAFLLSCLFACLLLLLLLLLRMLPPLLQYLDGPEVDCDLVFSEGQAVYGAVTDNWPTVSGTDAAQ